MRCERTLSAGQRNDPGVDRRRPRPWAPGARRGRVAPARTHRLRATGEADVTTPPRCAAHVRGFLVWVTDVYAAHDVDALLAIVTEDVVFPDHRPLGADPIVAQAAVAEWTRS